MTAKGEKENASIFSFVGGGTSQPFGFFGSAAKPPLSQAKPFAESNANNLPEGPKALKFDAATLAQTAAPSSKSDNIDTLTECSNESEELGRVKVLLQKEKEHAASLQAALDKSATDSEKATAKVAAKEQQAEKLHVDLKVTTSKVQRLETDLRTVTSKAQKLEADLKAANSKVQKLERDLRAANSEAQKQEAAVKAAHEATEQEGKLAAKAVSEKASLLANLEQEFKAVRGKAADESKRVTAALALKDSQIQQLQSQLATARQPQARPQSAISAAVSSPSAGFNTPEAPRGSEGPSPCAQTPAQDSPRPRDSRIQSSRWLVMDAPAADPLVSFCIGERRVRLGRVLHVMRDSCTLHCYSLPEGEQLFVPIADEGGWPVFETRGVDGAGILAAFDALESPTRGGGGRLPGSVRKELEGCGAKSASLPCGTSSTGPIPFL